MVRHEMDVEQIMSLLASAQDPTGRLIPQLREVAVWTATLDDEVLTEVLAREPHLLLRGDGLVLSDEARSRVVASLLEETAAVAFPRFDRRMQRGLRGLVHPGLADQVRRALKPDQSVPVRQMGFTVAKATELPELLSDLVAFALNSSEPAFLRDDAIWTLKDYADEATRRALVPLALQRIDDDEDDEIKGQALAATFPSILGVGQVLPALTPARNDHLLGGYKSFVLTTLPDALTPSDLPNALEWVRLQPRDHDADDLLSSFADAVLAASWPHLGDERVRSAFVAAIVPRLREHLDLLGPLHPNSDTSTFREQPTRRLLVSELVQSPAAQDIEPRLLTWSTPTLALPDDFSWAVNHLRGSLGGPHEARWADLAAALFLPETCDIQEFFELVDRSPAFADRTSQWRTSISLDSDVAQLWRRRAERKRARVTPPARDAPDMDQVIRGHLEALETGDAAAWWRLNVDLIYDEHGQGDLHREIEADLTRLDGWKRATSDIRERIVAGARQYLNEAPPDADTWIEKDTINRAAYAGYRALHLLALHRPRELEALDRDVWTRWMPVIVAFPRFATSDDEGQDDLLLELAGTRDPQALTTWVLRLVDLQNAKNEGHLFVLSRLRHIKVIGLADALGRPAKNSPGSRPRPLATSPTSACARRPTRS